MFGKGRDTKKFENPWNKVFQFFSFIIHKVTHKVTHKAIVFVYFLWLWIKTFFLSPYMKEKQ
jgi:hypothetical protein